MHIQTNRGSFFVFIRKYREKGKMIFKVIGFVINQGKILKSKKYLFFLFI